MMRVYLCGSRRFGAEALGLLLRLGHDVAGVSAPAMGRGDTMDRLRDLAHDHRIPWMPAGTLTADALPAETDLIVAAHSHDFIGRKTRLRAAIGAIGYHPSLLPLHRGRDAIRWAVHMGDRVTGGSVYWLSETVDGGDIAAQDWCFIQPGDTPEELWRRDLMPMGLRLIEKTLRDLDGGVMVRIPQNPALITWEPAWERPPLRRPDLDLIGTGPGLRVVRERVA